MNEITINEIDIIYDKLNQMNEEGSHWAGGDISGIDLIRSLMSQLPENATQANIENFLEGQ